MTDQSNQDQIHWWESRIIWLQIIGAGAAILALFGHAISPDDQQNLVNAATTFAGVIVTVFTIYHRIAKPCPPIKPSNTNNINK